MSKRTMVKTEWYAQLLQRLHIISEQEKRQIVDRLRKQEKEKQFS